MIALPAHAPCGNHGGGEVDSATLVAVCTAVRSSSDFQRCGCKRDPKRPTRGADNCVSCRGSGCIIVGTRPGCGATFAVCRRCGLRACINGAPCTSCNPAASSAGKAAA